MSDAYSRTEGERSEIPYNPEHCYMMSRLEPYPKYWERGEQKQFVRRFATDNYIFRFAA